jgi:hypothetical protein
MDPNKLFHDDRLARDCTYCGAWPSTRDHVPSKVLLDEPYPEQLPVVKACERCNHSFALDEEYVACFVDCVLAGSAYPTAVRRPKVRRLLAEKPSLAALIDQSRRVNDAGIVLWRPDTERVKNVLLKLARGHATFENAESYREEPITLCSMPLPLMPADQRTVFEDPPPCDVWPEIGTRAFGRMVVLGTGRIRCQPNRLGDFGISPLRSRRLPA